MPSDRIRSAFARYIAPVILVAVAVGLNLLLARHADRSAAPLLFAAVLFAGWQGGWRAGLIATILATLCDDYFFIPPYGIDFSGTVRVRLLVFLAVAMVTSYLTATRRRAIEQRDRLLVSEREARRAAELANSAKDRFLAAASHELRSPLTAISLWTEILGRTQLSADTREAVETIQDCVQTQRRMVDDLLDVARLTTGKLRIDPQPIPLADAVAKSVAAARPSAQAKHIDLALAQDAAPDTHILADPTRLAQIVTNLLTNAIKFTPDGGHVDVQTSTANGHAVIRVTDTGRGIDPAHLAHVFERFWQAGGDGPTQKPAGDGLGLGLAIVHDLVHLHGGQIHAESQGPGHGASFIVELPLARPPSRPPDRRPSSPRPAAATGS